MSKVKRNTRRALHKARVRAERELKGEDKSDRQEEKARDAQWREIVRSLKGVAPWK